MILGMLGLSGALIRHWFNLKGKGVRNPWLLPLSAGLIAVVAVMTAPRNLAHGTANQQVSDESVQAIIQQRCVSCHSTMPSDDVFTVAPAGLVLENYQQSLSAIDRIYERAIASDSMPFANKTGMTSEERALLNQWYLQVKNQQH
jgi:uncharacterized membrane protein